MSSTTTTGPSDRSESGFITTTQTAALRWTSPRSTNGTSSRPVTYSIENPPGHNPVAAVTNTPSFPCSFVRAASRHSRSSRTPRRRRASAHCFRLPSGGAAFRSLYARLHSRLPPSDRSQNPEFRHRTSMGLNEAKSLIAVAGFARWPLNTAETFQQQEPRHCLMS